MWLSLVRQKENLLDGGEQANRWQEPRKVCLQLIGGSLLLLILLRILWLDLMREGSVWVEGMSSY